MSDSESPRAWIKHSSDTVSYTHLDYDRFEKEDEILEFTTLTPQEYEAFRNQHPYRDFMNSLKAMDLKKINHWDVEYVGVKEQDKVCLLYTSRCV